MMTVEEYIEKKQLFSPEAGRARDIISNSRPVAATDLLALSLRDFKDHCEKIDDQVKNKVLNYFKSFNYPIAIAPGYFCDLSTGELCRDKSYCYYSDGVYGWYSSEVYHFEKYDFKLSDEFVDYVLSKM